MAATFDKDLVSRSKGTYSALPEKIIIMPHLSGRKDYSDLEALKIPQLAHSIATKGQQTPALCRMNDDGEPILVFGRRRLEAVRYANKHLRHLFKPGVEEIEVIFTYAKMTDQEALIAAIGENSHREDVNLMDHAHNIFEALKFMPIEKVAAVYFPEAFDPKSTDAHVKANAIRWVRERGNLPELVPELQEKVRTGEIKVTEASKVAKMTPNEQREVLNQPTKIVAGKPRITAKAVKNAKAATKKATPKPPAKAKTDDSVPFDVPSHKPIPAPLPSNPVLAASEVMARAIDNWRTDATQQAEDKLIAAHDAYRVLVPFAQAEGKAA